MSKAPQLLRSQVSWPSLLVSRNLTALLLSPSPELSAFEELPIPGIVLVQVPNAANGEVVWQPRRVLPWPTLKRDKFY